MKKLATLMLTVAGLTLGSYALAQNTATATANATARIITPISIVANAAGLNFGDVVASGSAGTVVLATTGVRSTTGGASLGSASAVTVAAFTVSGQPSATYAITLPGSATVTSAVVNTMTVNAFTSNPSGTGTLSGGGSQPLLVGATLNVGISQVPGTYTGTFNVTVTYN